MQFQPGQSGNPAGRPPGSRNRKTLEVEAILAERAEATAKSILDRADAGNPAAMRLCMERIAPVGANRPVAIDLPQVNTPDDVAAAARAVMAALCQGAISAREAINLLTVVERAARLAERVQQMRERHEVWLTPSQASLREAARAALADVVKQEGIDGADLTASVDAEEAEPLYSPVNSGNEAAKTKASAKAAADETPGEGLYSPVNSTANAAAAPPNAQAPGSVLEGRRRALMESVSPAALLSGVDPVDPRSYVTDQKWLAALQEIGVHGATNRNAA
jgi:hypothetical protein